MDSNIKDNQLENPKPLKRNIFNYKKFVHYSKTKNTSKCLIRYCSHVFNGHITGNIKRHFETVHFLIPHHKSYVNHDDDDDDKEAVYIDDFNEQLRKYFDHYPLVNKTLCKYINCNTVIEDKKNNELLEHYKEEHNLDISKEDIKDIPQLKLNEIQDYDVNNKTYRCLYRKCTTHKMENTDDIKKHYIEKHDVIIKQKALDKQLYKYLVPCESSSNTEDIQTDEENSLTIRKKYTKLKNSIPKFEYSNYVQTFVEEDSSACLLETCDEMIKGIRPCYVKRHFFNKHSMCILYEDKFKATLDDYEQFFEQRYNETFYYDLDKFLTGYANQNSLYKCVFQDCTYYMAKELETIRNHYLQQHKILIIKTTNEKRKILNFLDLRKELFLSNCQKTNNFIKNMVNLTKATATRHNSIVNQRNRKIYPPLKLENYVIYVQENNISKCCLRNCKTFLTNILPINIKRHYLLMHNFKILQRSDLPPFEEIKRNLNDFKLTDFLYEQQQCLFINCNEVINNNWDLIQKHYYEIHKMIIIKNNKENPIKNKRGRYSNLSQALTYTEDYKRINNVNEDNTESNTYNDNNSNKTSSDDEDNTNNYVPIAKRLRNNPTKTEENLAAIYNNSLEDSQNSYVNFTIKENAQQQSTVISSQDILKEKRKFLLLCLGMTIQYDLPLEQFDDVDYLKPLLAPYEENINSDINAKLMENIIFIVNRSIMEEMEKCLNDRIICLELYILSCELKNYLIFNVRYVAEDKVSNRIIGYIQVTETTTNLPFSEILNKFNIEEQQVYMKTIATFQDNEETYNICNNLLKHNTDLRRHPLYELQLILRSFKQNYSEDLKKWQILTNYKEKFTLNMWYNLKDFAKYVKALIDKNNQLKAKLKEAKNFFKTLQIFWNFFNKLQGEQYVVGDFYRDLLACDLELENDVTKNNNKYAEYLKQKLMEWKNSLIETNEFLSALYLDARFNFLGTRLLNEEQKLKAKTFLVQIWKKFNNLLVHTINTMENNTNDIQNDDNEYALLDQYFNNTYNVNLQDKLTIWVPVKRESFGFDIFKFWSDTCPDLLEVKELMKITYTFPSSKYIIKKLEQNFRNVTNESIEYDRFIIKFNLDILEQKGDLILKDLS